FSGAQRVRSDALHDLNEAQVFLAQSDSERWNRLVSVLSGAASLLLICGLLALAFGFHRGVLRPILGLHETIARFRAGAVDSRASASGLHEMSDLAHGFNEMANALAEQ